MLENITLTKYLGVILRDDLCFSKHVEAVAAKGNSTVAEWVFFKEILEKTEGSNEVRKTSCTTVYNGAIVLEYASPVWDPRQKEDLDRLDKVQRRAVRYACNNYVEIAPGTVVNNLQACYNNSSGTT